MTPIISIVGWSGSGKTTLLEKLIPELVRRGYRVATVKHDVHGFDIDREGKDTWRHRRAGAVCTVISSSNQLALVRDMDHDASLEEIRKGFIADVDIILTEGYKQDEAPKVEVFRRGEHKRPIFADGNGLIALVSDTKFDLGVPCLGLDEISKLADIIEEASHDRL
ncbi:MAG: molybdopterin-guanine dinucleotide biosynthesis protein B [Spirochaetes bacterium RBG_13_51_14]|nr:MAG: molybdopterin-guanine dinucleotide biosynthesis protein B [Spirochaetes bacterium RBG_13_51_14]